MHRTFLVRQPDGSVKEFCESKSHLCTYHQQQKRNISFEIFIKTQSLFSHPLNIQPNPSNKVPQNLFISSVAPPLLPLPHQNPQPTFPSNSSMPLTQNNPNSSSTGDESSQFSFDFIDVQSEFETDVVFGSTFFDE